MTAPTPGTIERTAYDEARATLTRYTDRDLSREVIAVTVLQTWRTYPDTVRLAVLDAVLDHDQAEQDRERAALDEVIAAAAP